MNQTLSLDELFHGRIFRIPDYQRGYAWEKQQINEFLDDLELLDSTPGARRYHYTGTIVLLPHSDADAKWDGGSNRYVPADIVDGQQRLTTTILLLNEISKAFSPLNQIKADSLRQKYIEAKGENGLPLYKLTLGNDTHYFFRDRILPISPGLDDGPPVESAKRLLDAKTRIAEYLSKKSEAEENLEEWLTELQRKITAQLQFNLYEVESAAEVGIIFEVMNGRGKQLTDLEKIKNYLLYAGSSLTTVPRNEKERLISEVNNAFGSILRKLMASGCSQDANENQLLRSQWLLQYDPQPKNWNGSKSVRNEFDLRDKTKHRLLLERLRRYVHRIKAAAIAYCDVEKPNRNDSFAQFQGNPSKRDTIIQWSLKILRMRRIATFRPLLMSARIRWPGDPDKYLELLKLSEKLAFRTYSVARYNQNFRQPAMFRIAKTITDGADFLTIIQKIKGEYDSSYSRQQFAEFTNSDLMQNFYEWPSRKYFLYEYEEQLAKNNGARPRKKWESILREKDSIERVLPENIDNRPYWTDRFTPEEHQKYLYDLGNLTLTIYNSTLGNRPFPEKKGMQASGDQCYAESTLYQERQLTKWDDWTPRQSTTAGQKFLNGQRSDGR